MIGVTSNIDEIVERFKTLKEQLKGIDLSDALIVGVNAARGAMSFRIFNKGLDVGNVQIGSYRSKEYAKKRAKKGRQIQYKDLEFTGTLRRGILVIKETSVRVVCAIPSDRLYQIAKYQEEAIGAPIFALSDEERELLKTNVIAAVNQIYDRLFNPK